MKAKAAIAMVVLAVLWGGAAIAYASEATITSDELELQNNGEVTIFRGHVVLKQDPYEVRADRMVRTKATEVVDANGHAVGTWISAKGEKVRVEGEQARYQPSAHTVEVWGAQQVTVFVEGEKGKSTFHGDRGWMYTLAPGKAKLSGHVTGHVIPI
jgi:lipopolysaccharide transport protein LptA